MSEQEASMKNTKKEMLDIIKSLQKGIEEREKTKLNAEQIREETKKIKTLEKADKTAASNLSTELHSLKISINKELTALSDKIEAEAEKYKNLNQAISLKQIELEEIYGIEKEAAKLAAILEAQNQTKNDFEKEMAEKRERQGNEFTVKRDHQEKQIAETKTVWEKEKSEYLEKFAEEKSKVEKEQLRENEEYEYQLKRTRELEQNSFADEKEQIEREIKQKKDEFEQFRQTKSMELNEREKHIAERELVMDELREQVDSFPAQLEKAVNSAEKQTDKILSERFSQNEALLLKGFEGERNVFETKNIALESLVKDQAKQIDKLNNQQEKAYKQVQDIASKAVAGSVDRPQNITVKTTETGKIG